MSTFFPLGTSRLHETLEAAAELAAFPHFGYFHSSSQMRDVIQILQGERTLSVSEARYFFRKDQTPSNTFDTRLWNDDLPLALENARAAFVSARHVIVEISSPRTYRWGQLHVQGNPNHFRDVPYSEVWRDGYYAHYDPDADVQVFDDVDEIDRNVRAIAEALAGLGKRLTLLGHLVDPAHPNAVRVANNRSVAEAALASADLGVRFFDTTPLVAEFGFRVLPTGVVDIHHLPANAYPTLVKQLTAV